MKRFKDIFDRATPEDFEMISYNLNAEALGEDQLDSIKEKFFAKTKIKRKNKKKKIRYWTIAVAACLCVAVCLGIVIPTVQKGDPIPSTMTVGEKLIGKHTASLHYENVKEDSIDDNVYVDYILSSPEFRLSTVIEAEVVEVYPDLYRDGTMGTIWSTDNDDTCHVAKVKVLDSLRGSGFPDEIFISYQYYGTDIFDGYDSFLMSLRQVGVEDYVLINDTQGRIDYFSNMFVVEGIDIGYGGVIAFSSGIVDEAFWEKANRMEQLYPKHGSLMKRTLDNSDTYPAKRGSTISEVKENLDKFRWNIFNLFNKMVEELERDYITADDLFITDEAKAIRSYLKSGEGNVFKHHIVAFTNDGIKIIYTRLINGFETDEEIVINAKRGKDGGVTRYGEGYTGDDLKKVPDIGLVIEGLDLVKLRPPSVNPVINGFDVQLIIAGGVYRKIDGKLYGIIRVYWKMTDGERSARDALYYLYDENGEGGTVSEKKLKKLIGDDKLFVEDVGVVYYHCY